MSDLMLYGVLRMPFDMAMSGHLSQRQFYDRVQEAARRLEAAEARLAEIDAATPPSPSTAPEVQVDHESAGHAGAAETCRSSTEPSVDERAAFEAWLADPNDEPWTVFNTWRGGYRAALASRPATASLQSVRDKENAESLQQARPAGASRKAAREREVNERFTRDSRAEVGDVVRDAERYRWMRDQAQWFKAGLAKTVCGACAFHYGGELLDQLVDAGRGAGAKPEGSAR